MGEGQIVFEVRGLPFLGDRHLLMADLLVINDQESIHSGVEASCQLSEDKVSNPVSDFQGEELTSLSLKSSGIAEIQVKVSPPKSV